jgi:type VI secretion system protein ImpA
LGTDPVVAPRIRGHGSSSIDRFHVGAMLDIEALLQPIAADAPGGPNLEYSAAYAELERTARGKPERRIGEALIAAEDPDWARVIAQSVALLEASKDLRVAGQLARALFKVRAFEGLAEGLSVLRQLVDRYWEDCHPRLDEEENDPTSRVNAVAWLTHRDMLLAVRAAPLVNSKVFGVVTWREIEASRTHGEGHAKNAAAVEGAFANVPLAELAEATRAVGQCGDEVIGLEKTLTARLEMGAPDFADIKRVLAQASAAMKSHLEIRQAASSSLANSPPSPHANSPPSPLASEGGVANGARAGIHTRQDVVSALDRICAYYAQHEPSSPVPLLLERCKRLVTMSFLDIVKDMLPTGVSTIETIAGKSKE